MNLLTLHQQILETTVGDEKENLNQNYSTYVVEEKVKISDFDKYTEKEQIIIDDDYDSDGDSGEDYTDEYFEEEIVDRVSLAGIFEKYGFLFGFGRDLEDMEEYLEKFIFGDIFGLNYEACKYYKIQILQLISEVKNKEILFYFLNKLNEELISFLLKLKEENLKSLNDIYSLGSIILNEEWEENDKFSLFDVKSILKELVLMSEFKPRIYELVNFKVNEMLIKNFKNEELLKGLGGFEKQIFKEGTLLCLLDRLNERIEEEEKKKINVEENI